MIRASTSQSVDRGIIFLIKSYHMIKKNGIHSSLLGAQHKKKSVENKPGSSLVMSMGKTPNGMPPSLRGRQLAGPTSQTEASLKGLTSRSRP